MDANSIAIIIGSAAGAFAAQFWGSISFDVRNVSNSRTDTSNFQLTCYGPR